MNTSAEWKGDDMFKVLPKLSRTDQVVEEIKEAVLSGRLVTGNKLPPERELAVRFGVSRTSVREAMKILNTYGLIRPVQGDGIYVTDQFSENVFAFLGHDKCLTADNYALLYQARLVMETGAVMDAAANATADDFAKLEDIILSIGSETDVERLGVLDADFHITLIKIARNPILTSLYQMLYKIMANGAPMGVTVYPSAKRMVVAGHTKIVAALKTGSRTRCYNAVAKHLNDSRKLYDKLFRER